MKHLYIGLGDLITGEDDDQEITEDLWNAWIVQMAVTPVNAIPLLDDIVTAAARKLSGQKIWKVFSTPLFDDLETGIRKLLKKRISAADYLEVAGSILEPVTQTPIKTPLRIWKYMFGEQRKR